MLYKAKTDFILKVQNKVPYVNKRAARNPIQNTGLELQMHWSSHFIPDTEPDTLTQGACRYQVPVQNQCSPTPHRVELTGIIFIGWHVTRDHWKLWKMIL